VNRVKILSFDDTGRFQEVNKFDRKIGVLFDTKGSAPYKGTVISALTRLAAVS